MTILFDQGVPAPLRKQLAGHTILTAAEQGWAVLNNGDLLAEAESSGFDCLVTTDQNLRYQQNIAERKIGVVVLLTTSWPRIQRKIESVQSALDSITEGDYVEVDF